MVHIMQTRPLQEKVLAVYTAGLAGCKQSARLAVNKYPASTGKSSAWAPLLV